MNDELIDFDCPRCEGPATAPFYGPCEGCVEELRAASPGKARLVLVEEYEPKMNVTPNAVALKD